MPLHMMPPPRPRPRGLGYQRQEDILYILWFIFILAGLGTAVASAIHANYDDHRMMSLLAALAFATVDGLILLGWMVKRARRIRLFTQGRVVEGRVTDRTRVIVQTRTGTTLNDFAVVDVGFENKTMRIRAYLNGPLYVFVDGPRAGVHLEEGVFAIAKWR
jgi:hypothetical protein